MFYIKVSFILAIVFNTIYAHAQPETEEPILFKKYIRHLENSTQGKNLELTKTHDSCKLKVSTMERDPSKILDHVFVFNKENLLYIQKAIYKLEMDWFRSDISNALEADGFAFKSMHVSDSRQALSSMQIVQNTTEIAPYLKHFEEYKNVIPKEILQSYCGEP